ncbi:MAG: helix-turn-helix domain-containing protein [Pseudomonadales bacterium]|jgi:AraC-like DNA-binding protein
MKNSIPKLANKMVWFVGPASLSVYNFAGENGYLPTSRAAEMIEKSNEAAERGETYTIPVEDFYRDMDTILNIDQKAYEVFWKGGAEDQHKAGAGGVVRATYAISQPTIRELVRCFTATTLMDTNSVFNVLIEGAHESSMRFMPKIEVPDWQHLFLVKQFLLGSSNLGATSKVRFKRLIYQGREVDPAEFYTRLPLVGAFSDQCTEIVWDNEVLDQPSVMANAARAQSFEAMVRPTLVSRQPFAGMHEKVLVFIDTRLRAGQEVSMPLAAEAFGMEASTLRRRLAQQGVKFSQVLQDYRRKDAMRLLCHGYSVKDVSTKLGYSEASSFQHAFKIWYNAPPKRFYRNAKTS